MTIVPLAFATAQSQMQTGDGLLQVQTQMPQESKAGEQFKYMIMARNSSDDVILHDIVLEQSKSEGFSIESSSIQGEQQSGNQRQDPENSDKKQAGKKQSGKEQTAKEMPDQRTGNSSGRFTIDKLEPGQSQTITVMASADKEGQLKSCLQIVSYKPSLCMTSTVVKPALQITKNAPERADRCNEIELMYTVKNDGTGDVGTFQIVDDLGDGLKTIEGNSTLKFEVDGLQAGDTRQFVARVFAAKAGSFSSRARAEAENSELKSRSAKTTTEVVAADLAVTVEGPGRIYGEKFARFTAHVTNTGNTPAEQVAVNVMWPSETSLADISDFRINSDRQGQATRPRSANDESNRDDQKAKEVAGAGASNSVASNDNSKNQAQQGSEQNMSSDEFVIDRLEAGQTATFDYAVRPAGMEQVKTQVQALYVCAVNVAEGEDKATNRVTSNGYGQATFVRLPAMQLSVIDDEDPVSDGTMVTYTIRVTNEGNGPEQNIHLTAELPEGLEFESAKGPTEFQQNGSTITFEPIETMRAGVTVNYKVIANNTGDGSVAFKATSVAFKATLNSESLDQGIVAEEPTKLVSK